MRLHEILLERKETYSTLQRRSLTPEEKDYLGDFQQVLALLKNFFKAPNRDDLEKLLSELHRYHNRPFMRTVNNWIAKTQAHHRSIADAAPHAEQQRKQLTNIINTAHAALKSGDAQGLLAAATNARRVNQILDVAMAKPNKTYDREKANPLYIQNPLFFGTTNFLEMFEHEHMDNVIAINPDAVFTYMNAPFDDNFQFFAYWAMELSEKGSPATLSPSQYNKWIRIQFKDDPKFQRLIKMVATYLHDNDKSLLVEIRELMKEFPTIEETHRDVISEITTVYRGIAFNEDNDDQPSDFVAHDRERGMVATSHSKYVAKNFALSKGHLDGGGGRTDGVILSYNVKPHDVILDTSVFGGIFGESEVVINAATAKVSDQEYVYMHRDDDYN
jgi:hypothetical protein